MANDDEGLGALIAGVLLGLGAFALWDAVRPRCPHCEAGIKRHQQQCNQCRGWITWD